MNIISNVLLILVLCHSCSFEKVAEDDPSHLIDSLVIPLVPEQNQPAKKPIAVDSNTWPVKTNDVSKPDFYPLANRIKPSDNSQWTGSQDVGEITCPKIYCYIIRDRQSGETRLDCKDEVTSSPDILTLIDCRFWLTSTSQRDSAFKESDFSQVNMNEGRGYDLKLLLRPASSRRHASSSPLLKVDRLSSGILQWIIRVMRENLNMRFSPIHLSISFMYFGRLGRDDLAILPISARVTRLSLWNPVKWDEDSFIAHTSHKSIAPPYFRLTVFCDHENRASSFERLWIPWKTWQIRFNHCPTMHSCRKWDSQFPICDSDSTRLEQTQSEISKKSFMPSFSIVAKIAGDRTPSAPAQYGSGMQILFNNQCTQDPADLEFLQDLKLDSVNGCWQPGAFVPKPITSTTTTSTTTTTSSSTSSILTDSPAAATPTPQPSTVPLAHVPMKNESLLSAVNDSIIMPAEDMASNLANEAPILIPAHQSPNEDPSSSRSVDTSPDNVRTAGSSESLSRLTYALILLAIFNILLLICFIFLVLWIRRKIRQRRQARQPMAKDSDPSQSDFVNYGAHENSFTPLIGPNHYSSHLTGLDRNPMLTRPRDSYSMPKLNHLYPGNGYPNPNFYPNESYVNTPNLASNHYQNGSLHLSLQRKRRRKSLNDPAPSVPPPPVPQRYLRGPSTANLALRTNPMTYPEFDRPPNSWEHPNLLPRQHWSDSRQSIHKPISTGNLNRPMDPAMHQSTLIVYPQRGVSQSSISKSIELLNRIDPLMTTSVPPRSPTRRDRSSSPRPKIRASGRKAAKKPHTLIFENGDLPETPFVSEALRKSLSQLP